jgi:hypothetical protein
MLFRKNFVSIVISFVFAVIGISCNDIFSGGRINEGSIVYEITYLDDEQDNPLIALLPKTMTTKFKDNNTLSTIEGFFGTFKLIYLSNYNDGLNYSILRILDKKYVYQFDTSQVPAGYNDMNNIKIEKTDEKVEIAGFKCNTVKAVCPEISTEPLIIYYTEQIKILSPNSNNPFKEIQGVLMGFQVKIAGINMKFLAKEVIKEEIDDKEFVTPDGYNQVSKNELEEILKSFQSQ